MSSTSRIYSRVLLRVENVRKRFDKTTALDGADLCVHSGELFGLLGPNGAGKTTLLSILSGLVSADGGSVTIGDELVNPGRTIVRKRIGLAPQDLAIYNDLTARENLAFFARLYGLQGAAQQNRIVESLKAVQLLDRADDRAGTFSGGMKRRLNLAIAVVHQPELLLLDEPTTGVDPQSRNAIFEEVRRLNAAGTTVIYTSHYMEEVQALCPRVGIIDHGKMIRIGAVEELLALDESTIRFRGNNTLTELQKLAGVSSAQSVNGLIELRCREPAAVLPDLMRLMTAGGQPIDHLEVQRPTLERVFLRLTGHALRD